MRRAPVPPTMRRKFLHCVLPRSLGTSTSLKAGLYKARKLFPFGAVVSPIQPLTTSVVKSSIKSYYHPSGFLHFLHFLHLQSIFKVMRSVLLTIGGDVSSVEVCNRDIWGVPAVVWATVKGDKVLLPEVSISHETPCYSVSTWGR